MNKVKAIKVEMELFEKYCKKCSRLREDCRPTTEIERFKQLKQESEEDHKNKLTKEDIERFYKDCFESANAHSPWLSSE